MLFDSHAHINYESYTDEERAALAEEISQSDVKYVMDIGCDLGSSLQAVKDAGEYPWCYAVVGCHPHEVKYMDDMTLELISGLTKKPKVKAIGEIGLDYHYDFSPREEQREWFRKQIRLANELRLPIVIHSREASMDTMDILKEERAFSEERKSWFPKRPGLNGEMVDDARVLLHCYSGSAEEAWQYVKLGGTISMAGPLTFKNNKKGVLVATKIPIEFLLVETDSPYLAPEPHRGKKNKSVYVEYTARRLAAIKGLTYEEVCAETTANAKRFFNID
ncbi:TatD DNase family protein [Peptostreptococcaceae bacterium pGA-8]|nr:TatD DNase family protein [Peptostreptococcaceae bacterium pGA-8]